MRKTKKVKRYGDYWSTLCVAISAFSTPESQQKTEQDKNCSNPTEDLFSDRV